MRVLQSSEMKEMDRKTIEELGIPSRVLMERAGVSVVLSMQQELQDLTDLSFVVVVGKGNNGGDGLVVARTLLDFSPNVTAILLTRDLKGNPLENLKVFEKLGGETLVLEEDIDFTAFESILMSTDVIVDALLGIGLKGEVKNPISHIIDVINSSPAYKVCIDISSGIDSDTGKVMGKATKCDLTVTFAVPKIGHVLYPGREYTGKLKVASIGIPKILLETEEKGRVILGEQYISSILPIRVADSNKGTFGKVGIVAGSKLYTGAPVLTALGAMRSGCGLTFLLVPENFNTVATSNFPEIISIPIKSCDGFFCKDSIAELLNYLDNVDVVAIGPGLSRKDAVSKVVNEIVKLEKPMVIDADGINNLDLSVLKERSSDTVLTPHPGELARLLGKNVEEVKYNYKLAEEFAKKHGCVLVLKSATTIITDGETTYFNLTGNNALAKGGSGDVLTGMIASFMAQGLLPLDAAAAGVYIHGLTANLYRGDPASMLPSEIANLLPQALQKLRKK